MTLQYFTDYGCPFCYIAFLMCKRIRERTGCEWTPVWKEIHDELPPQGVSSEFYFSEEMRKRMNVQLKEYGAPYDVAPVIGTHLSSTRAAILIRYYLEAHVPGVLPQFDLVLYEARHLENRDIGDMAFLNAVLKDLSVLTPTEEMIPNEEAVQKWLWARRTAALYDVRKTPTFLIGKEIYRGLMPEEELLRRMEESRK